MERIVLTFHSRLDYMFVSCMINTSSRVLTRVLQMFISALFSFILYTLIFLRLRGNIVVKGWRVTFHMTGVTWRGKQSDRHAMAIARQMLLYVVCLIPCTSH